jgi:hypothetical protein
MPRRGDQGASCRWDAPLATHGTAVGTRLGDLVPRRDLLPVRSRRPRIRPCGPIASTRLGRAPDIGRLVDRDVPDAPGRPDTLRTFHEKIRPMGPGWRGAGLGLEPDPDAQSPSAAFLAWFLACVVVYGALCGTGYALYGRALLSTVCFGVAAAAGVGLLQDLAARGCTLI